MHSIRRVGPTLFAVYAVAFGLRLIAGLLKGPNYVDNGYAFYAEIASTLVGGGGFCMAPNFECAVRMPLFPLIVAPFLAAGAVYPWLIVFHALVGSATAVMAYPIGAHLFNRRIGLLAAMVAAANPYAIIHGPAFQDTVIVNALFALAVVLLLRSTVDRRVEWALAAGITLGLMVLTTARMLPIAGAAVLWAAVYHRRRLHVQCAVILPVVLLVGGWVARNAYVVGAPVLTTESGLSLWVAHNDLVEDVIPEGSIDAVEGRLWAAMDPATLARIDRLADQPVARDRALGLIALDYIRSHPFDTVRRTVKKVLLSVGGWLSPMRPWPIQFLYSLIFVPINAAAIVALWRSRNADPAHGLVMLIIVAFLLTTAVFWAHTSHRSYLHVLKITYALSVLSPIAQKHVGTLKLPV